MLKRFMVLGLLLLVIVTLTACGQAEEVDPEELKALASEFVAQLADNDFSSAYESFSADKKSIMTLEQLQSDWEKVIQENGDFVSEGQASLDKMYGYDAVIVNCQFQSDNVDVIVIYNADQEVAELFFDEVAVEIEE